MLQENLFVRDDVLPSWFANAIQKFLSTAAPSFQLSRADGTHIQVVAGANIEAAVLSIAGKWRWSEATINRAHPGGAAGTYDIYATAANSKISGAGVDETNYAIGLRIVEAGKTPTIEAGTVDIYRKVGSLTWTGTAISSVTQTIGHRAEVVYPVGPQLSVSATRAPVGGEWVQVGAGAPVALPSAATPNKVIGVCHTGASGLVEITSPAGSEVWTFGFAMTLQPGEAIIFIADGNNWITQEYRHRSGQPTGRISVSVGANHNPKADLGLPASSYNGQEYEVMIDFGIGANPGAGVSAQLWVNGQQRQEWFCPESIVGTVGSGHALRYGTTFTLPAGAEWSLVKSGGGNVEDLHVSYQRL